MAKFKHQLRAYAVAVAAVGVATAVRWFIAPGSTSIVPFATYFPAVLLTALYAGFRPGLFAAILSVVVAEYLFVEPVGEFSLERAPLIAAALFLANALIVAALAARTQQLIAERDSQHKALETLHAEQGHRISNKLTLISSLLTMQISGADDERVKDALRQALARVQSMARVHEHLQRGIANEKVAAKAYLGELCRNMATMADAGRVQIECEAADIELDVQRALPFGMIMTELVTNALKHAYPPPSSGQISVTFNQVSGEYVLVVSDAGAGLPENFEHTGRLGVKVVRSLVSQLRGSMKVERGNGTTFEIRAPA